MKKQLTVWQASVLFAVCVLSTKFQRLPALMAQDFGRDIGVMLIIMTMFDFLIGLLFINLLCKHKDMTFFDLVQQKLGSVGRFIISLLIALYFFGKTIITYKGTHEFFANILFDKLSWSVFSLLLVVMILIMVIGGLNVIGRSAELYVFVIGICAVAVIGLGLVRADFQSLFPILHTGGSEKFLSCIKFQPWMGDYVVVLLLMGNIKIQQNQSARAPLIWAYALSAGLNIIGTTVFYAVNQHMSVFQPNALSALTQYTLVTLGIGRPDWFLVLFVFISKLIATAMYVYGCSHAITEMFNIKKPLFVELAVVGIIYIIDNFVLVNIEKSVGFVQYYLSYYMFGVCMLLTILVCIFSCLKVKKKRGRKAQIKNTQTRREAW